MDLVFLTLLRIQPSRLNRRINDMPVDVLNYPFIWAPISILLTLDARIDPDARIIDAALSIEGLHGGCIFIAVLINSLHLLMTTRSYQVDTKGMALEVRGYSVADMGLLWTSRTENPHGYFSFLIKNVADYWHDNSTDPEIYRLLPKGTRTAGTFQVESAGMTATIKGMRPTEYKHIVLIIYVVLVLLT